MKVAFSSHMPSPFASEQAWSNDEVKTASLHLDTSKKSLNPKPSHFCNLTGFATLASVPQLKSDVMARLAFSHFFAPNGLPKLVIIDGGSEFKGVLITMCDQIGIQHHAAAPKAHNAILCECFHGHLNKVKKIGAADAQSCEQWAMNALFAAHAWNGSPVDGTDVIRSFAAKART
jgi:hypothetical protein